MIGQATRTAKMLLSTLLLASCAALPSNGPDGRSVVEQASTRLMNPNETIGYDYPLVEVTRAVLPFMTDDPPEGSSTFGVSASTPPDLRLGVGDIIQITIFESQAGGLFIPREAGARPGNFVVLPRQEIGRNGTILVPYAGELTAAGQTIDVLEQNIRNRLEASAIEPQVSIEIIERNFARATLVGAVNRPGLYALRANGNRILDLIAQAGGISSPAYNSYVTLSRGNAVATIPYETLANSPTENIFVAPGDTINVTTEPKKYYVFGASGLIGEFDFNDTQIDLRTALGFAAGLLDARADPSDVFIYRTETRQALIQMGMAEEELPDGLAAVPTIYRVDFRMPDSFFLSSHLRLRDGDVLYIANADQVSFSRLIGFARTVTGGAVGLDRDIRALRD
jgi:polysaccharide biosynthesis/export protein